MSETSGCLLCGKPLVYLQEQAEMECALCHAKHWSNAECEAGHYICDACHERMGLRTIRDFCLQSRSKNPTALARQIMIHPSIFTHGPEHHTLVGAALLTACKNAGAQLDLERALDEMERRGAALPGGICGMNGCCGAAVSAGTFLSILTETTPLSGETWGLCNRLTGRCLEAIGTLGGPRCCKRDSFTAILTAADFVKEHLGLELERDARVSCGFTRRNFECIRERCPYFCGR